MISMCDIRCSSTSKLHMENCTFGQCTQKYISFYILQSVNFWALWWCKNILQAFFSHFISIHIHTQTFVHTQRYKFCGFPTQFVYKNVSKWKTKTAEKNEERSLSLVSAILMRLVDPTYSLNAHNALTQAFFHSLKVPFFRSLAALP